MKPNAKISWRRAVPALMLALAIAFTLPQKARAQEEFKRDIEQISFVPKGQWITGVSVSYTQSSQDNYQFLVVENLNGDAYTFKVSPMVMYAFKDNLAAGGRVAYSRQRVKLDQADVVLGEDTNYNVDHLYSISHSYSVAGAFRNYISLGNSTRFGIFNEVDLMFQTGASRFKRSIEGEPRDTRTNITQASLNFSPGVCCFLQENLAFNVSFGVFGLRWRHEKQTTNGEYNGSRFSSGANFRFNIFNINFGLMVVI